MATNGHKLITCLLPLRVALPLVKSLETEKGIATAHVGNARGVGKLTSSARRQLGDQTEKQVLTVVVDESEADDIFSFLYFEGGINEPHGGMIFMSPVETYVPLILPDVPEEED